MLEGLIIPFVAIFFAEMGDKTQLAVFCLASKTKNYKKLLFGVASAFIVAEGIAVIAGSILTSIISVFYIQIFSGVIFVIFGVNELRKAEKDNVKCSLKSPFLSGFWMILMSETGDKSQIAAGLFAANFNPFTVFISVVSALILLSVIAVCFGNKISEKVNANTMSKIAGIIFIISGLSVIFL